MPPHAELMARCILFLLKTHHKQVTAHRALLPTLHQIDDALTKRLATEQTLVGYNLAAMRCMARTLEQNAEAKLFESQLNERKQMRAEGHGAAASVGELRRRASLTSGPWTFRGGADHPLVPASAPSAPGLPGLGGLCPLCPLGAEALPLPSGGVPARRR